MVHKGGAFIGLAIIVIKSAHNYIAISITIYIACRCYRISHPGNCLVAFYGSRCGGANTACTAMVHKGCTFIGLAIIVQPSPHNHIAVPIAIYIACRCYGITHLCIYLVAFYRGNRRGVNAGSSAIIYISPPFISLSIIEIRYAHNYIAVSISIYIA